MGDDGRSTVTLDVGHAAAGLAAVAVALLFAGPGWMWLAVVPAAAAAVYGIRGLRRGSGWAAVAGTVTGSGVLGLLFAILVTTAWRNLVA